MKSLRHLSFSGLALLLMASTLPVGCDFAGDLLKTTPTTEGVVEGQHAGITGIVYTGRSLDGRLVPPTTPIKVQIMEQDEEILSVFTDNLGRFFIGDIPTSPEGKEYSIKVGGIYDELKTLFPGRILNLSSIQASTQNNSTQAASLISGTLLGSDGSPLSNVKVQDKEFSFRSTTTNDAGEFTLEVVSDEIEVIVNESQPPVPISVDEIQKNQLLKVEVGNVRSISGIVIDGTNSNIPLKGVKLRVQSRSTSTTSTTDGNFVLNGAPIGPFILEAQPIEGYAPFSIQIPPATFDTNKKPKDLVQNVAMRPIGSILVNFHAEDAPFFDRLPACDPFNCRYYDLNPQDGTPEAYYHNSLGTRNDRQANITVEGTDITQQVIYPKAELLTLKGTDLLGEVVTITEAVTAPNYVVSVLLDDIPGGKQNITISMTGMQTQKSIPIYVPPKDTISSDLITLYYVQQINALGDVKGFIKGIDPDLDGDIRIGYIDLTDNLAYEPRLNDRTDPELLGLIQSAITSPRSTLVNKETGEYYLKNVPTGTRVMLAAGTVDESGELSGCYVPNTAVLLNVRAGEINLAPDVTVTKRPIAGCN